MLQSKPYYDLCVNQAAVRGENALKTLKDLYSFGFRTIAVNQEIDDENFEPKKKKKKGEPREPSDVVPNPLDLTPLKTLAKELDFEDFIVLNRLTILFSNQDNLHKITKSPNYKKYDLVAVQPTTLAAFAFTCATLEADILSFNSESKLPWKINRKLYYQLIERGYHFEVSYGQAIEDSTRRRNIIQTALLYQSIGKSKNIIISSATDFPIFLRSPQDIMNLGSILGLNPQQCKGSVQDGRKVLVNAIRRRQGKAVMFVENLEQPPTIEAISIQDSGDDGDDVMEVEGPAQKKTKTIVT